MENELLLTIALHDLKVDLEYVQEFLEDIERKISILETKHIDKKKTSYKFSNHQIMLVSHYVRKCLKYSCPITTQGVLQHLDLDPEKQALQQKVSKVLRNYGLIKIRRRVDGKLRYIWVEKNNNS